jgi:hypothetical protein
MKGARFTVPTPALLAKVVDLIAELPMEDRDTKGDLYEYMLSKIPSAGRQRRRRDRHSRESALDAIGDDIVLLSALVRRQRLGRGAQHIAIACGAGANQGNKKVASRHGYLTCPRLRLMTLPLSPDSRRCPRPAIATAKAVHRVAPDRRQLWANTPQKSAQR